MILILREIGAALLGSKWVRRLGLALLAVGSYAMWQSHVENRGAERVVVKVEKKANANAATAMEIREEATSAKSGRADPYLRR